MREKRQERGTVEEDGGGSEREGGAQTHPPQRQEEEEEEEEERVEGKSVPLAASPDGSNLDDTTARITSLLQRIEGDPLQETQENG